MGWRLSEVALRKDFDFSVKKQALLLLTKVLTDKNRSSGLYANVLFFDSNFTQ